MPFLAVSWLPALIIHDEEGWNMKTCSQCGTRNPDDAISCSGCGEMLSAQTPAGGESAQPNSSPASASASPSASSPSPGTGSQYVNALNPVAGSGDLFTGAVEVNGQYYANSVYLDLNPGPADVSYNLGRQWRHLEATLGLSDDSPENEKVQFQIFADGRSIYSHVFALGQSQQITLDVTRVLRLELVATLSSAYVGQAEAVWGNADLTS